MDYQKLSIRNGKPVVRRVKDAVNIQNVDELKAQLKHYSKGAGGPLFIRNLLPPQQDVRSMQLVARNYVEYVRPALRFYCNKYGVDIPDWLKTDNVYTTMAKQDMLSLFGVTELSSREFSPLKIPTVKKKQHA